LPAEVKNLFFLIMNICYFGGEWGGEKYRQRCVSIEGYMRLCKYQLGDKTPVGLKEAERT
jgi:hypothetical protein